MTKVKIHIIILLQFSLMTLFAQNSETNILFSSYIQNILKFHPSIQNFKIQTVDKSKTYITYNRGNFDPKIYHNLDEKLFQTKNYYSYINSGIKIPTWIGVDIKTEYNYNSGLYINSSDYLPSNGLWSVGASIPTLRNLFIDERRWKLKSAKLNLRISEQEYNEAILNFLSSATYKYWEWFEIYNKYLIIKNAVEVSKQRLFATINSFKLGDVAAIDTIETAIQYNNFLLQQNIYETELQNIKNEIQYFMQWDNNQFIFQYNYNYYPEKFIHDKYKNTIIESKLIDSLIYRHPAYQKYQLKLKNFYLEKKFRMEMLKPELNFIYHALLIPSHPSDLIYNSNNYKWGINFSFPLLLRKERSELKLVNLKIKETEIDADLKKSELFIKATNYYNLYKTYLSQLQNIDELIKKYETMLDVEREKFFAGESSVFLVNARENDLLEAKIKQIGFYSKLCLYKNLLEISLGQIPQ